MSRSDGATRSTGSRRVVMRKVARESVWRSFSADIGDFVEKMDPMWLYSCAKTIASSLLFSLVKKRVQKSRTDSAEVRSHSSANMLSLLVVERRRDMSISTRGDVMGSGDNAITWAPRSASELSRVSPSGVNAP